MCKDSLILRLKKLEVLSRKIEMSYSWREWIDHKSEMKH
jgi:hypothetical protein